MRRRALPESGCCAPSLYRASRCDSCANFLPEPLPWRSVRASWGVNRRILLPGCVCGIIFRYLEARTVGLFAGDRFERKLRFQRCSAACLDVCSQELVC